MRALAKDISYDIHRVFDFRTVGMQYPNRIIFGCGAIDKIGEEAAQLGKGRALIISDEILEMIGTVSQVKDMTGVRGIRGRHFCRSRAGTAPGNCRENIY
jgi:hypothetical protein